MRFADLFFFPSSRLLCGLIALMGLLVASPARAQSPVDLAAAEQYTASLDHNFWEQAWVRHLDANTGSDGRIDWTYGDRQTLGALTDDYQRAIEAVDGFWTHLQVQDYLQRRLLTVQPNPMMAGRPGAFRLRLLRTTTPNALALNDGTILITTGLLTTLKTEAQLHAVLAHEVAHVVVGQVYGPETRPHGREWKAIMGDLFGADPSRCHEYDVTNAAQRTQARYPLTCGCMTHQVTARLVAQVVQNPGSRICRKCRKALQPADAATRRVGQEHGKRSKPGKKKKAGSNRQRRFAYTCPACAQELWLSATRHNRIQRGEARYQTGCCRRAFGPEAFTGKEA